MVINASNVFSEARDTVVSLINSNVTDPKTGSTNSRRKWLYREFPDTTSRDFAGYPIIVITSPETIDNIQDLCGVTSDADLRFTIDVYAEFNDVDARVDTICNAVYYALRSISSQATGTAANLHRPSIQAGPFITQDEDGKKVSTRRFLVTFESTLEAT